MCITHLAEKRSLVRYRMKNTLFAVIQGKDSHNMASIIDLNRKGIGFHLSCREKDLGDEFILLDLVSEKKRHVMRSLLARVVYARAADRPGNDSGDAPKRFGLEFVNLSVLEKRMIDLVARKYALPV
jgi:hypothetical protein